MRAKSESVSRINDVLSASAAGPVNMNTFEREAGREAIVFSYFMSRMYQLGHDVLIIQYSMD